MFFSKELNKTLYKDSWILKSNIKKQMPLTEATKILEDRVNNLKNFLTAFLIISIVIFVIGQTDYAM